MKEVDLNKPTKLFLREQGSTKIYGEVLNIDLVGKNKNILTAIELKTTLNTKVLEQALKRIESMNYTYVGIPYKNRHYREINIVYRTFLEYHGIGLLELYQDPKHDYHFYKILKPANLNRNATRYRRQINKEMNELRLDLDGGQASGNYETPYKKVVNEVASYLSKDRWTNIDVLVEWCDGLKQHYANPRASLYQLLNASWNSHFFERKPNTNEYRLRRLTMLSQAENSNQ